ncbi:MAG: hypothetical protein ACLSV2_12015 [Clostridium sp.]
MESSKKLGYIFLWIARISTIIFFILLTRAILYLTSSRIEVYLTLSTLIIAILSWIIHYILKCIYLDLDRLSREFNHKIYMLRKEFESK